MTSDDLAFVSFEIHDGKLIGFLSVEAAVQSRMDLEALLNEATSVYQKHIETLEAILVEMQAARRSRRSVSASSMWDVGNAVFGLRDDLQRLSLQLDGLYDHLTRDLGVKRNWLKKAIILRRYLTDREHIPESMNWGCLKDGTRKKAQRLDRGLPLE